MIQGNTFKIIPRVQHYEWGGSAFIPELLKEPNPQQKPYAELWMGTHPLCPSLIEGEEKISLSEFIERNKKGLLGDRVANSFNQLPYLLKVLDVEQMLSIQVHPNKEQAERGFEAEEKAGVAPNSKERNYKDRNHKPEVMVALSHFWLLHGFKQEQQLIDTLEAHPSFFELLPLFRQGGYKALYAHVMVLEQSAVDKLLQPIIERELKRKEKQELTREDAGWWVCKLFEDKRPLINIDRGIFSIYFFNLLHLKAGEAIFQAAGIPHAYLEGQNVELMANSDNVIRGGLTSKYIDQKELLKLTRCEGIVPKLLSGYQVNKYETVYNCPTPEFSISKLVVGEGDSYTCTSKSMEILFVLKGNIRVGEASYGKGEVIGIAANAQYIVTATETSELFKAFVPQL